MHLPLAAYQPGMRPEMIAAHRKAAAAKLVAALAELDRAKRALADVEKLAAKAPAPWIPDRSNTSRSKPMPRTRSPENSGESRLKAVLSRSMTATS